MKYLTAEQVLFIHSRIIDATGGAHGVRDISLLQSAVSRPRATFGGNDLYSGVISKAAALMESLARNHPFLDGNKRTAISATGVFLEKNGLRLEATQKELERFALHVAVKKISSDEAAAWLKAHIIQERNEKKYRASERFKQTGEDTQRLPRSFWGSR